MTQVSRRLLSKKVEEKILSLFVSSIVLAQNQDIALSLVEDILTPTEKVMLSKRFSIAFMLLEGYDYDTIQNVLKVSSSTIGRVALWLKGKGRGVRIIREKIKKTESLKNLWEDIKEGIAEIFLLSPGMNWQKSRSLLNAAKRERKKPF